MKNSVIVEKDQLPLMLSRPDVERLVGCGKNSAINLMKEGEKAGYYYLARIGKGHNARLKVHRDAFLGFLIRNKKYREGQA